MSKRKWAKKPKMAVNIYTNTSFPTSICLLLSFYITCISVNLLNNLSGQDKKKKTVTSYEDRGRLGEIQKVYSIL